MSIWYGYLLALIPLGLIAAAFACFHESVDEERIKKRAGILSLSSAILGSLGVWFLHMRPEGTTHLISTAPLNGLFFAFILFLALVLTRYSKNYLAGERRLAHYHRWFFLTIAAVLVTVISNHLLLFWGGWVSISLCLHQLLVFYPDRPRAVLAASKKFLLARTAETLLFGAFLLIAQDQGSLYISQILEGLKASIAHGDSLSLKAQWAAVLLALAALVKCAQFPMHGWLIQVMEAPTPVSALLHAGIINLGGFLLILFAPLFNESLAAKWLILVIAGLGTALSSLITTTRVSIKVRLAWSTTAQMGLMLIECALGYTELALLHLFAHSLYKVYSFLSSGEVVVQTLYDKVWPFAKAILGHWIFALAVSSSLTFLAYWFFGHGAAVSPWVLVSVGLSVFSLKYLPRAGGKGYFEAIALNALLLALYLCQKHLAAESGILEPVVLEKAFSLADLWILSLLFGLILLKWTLDTAQNQAWVEQLRIWLFAGFYMDEWFTRFTLWLRPQTLFHIHGERQSPLPVHFHETKGLYS